MSNGADDLSTFLLERPDLALSPEEIRRFGRSRSEELGRAMETIGIQATTRKRVRGVLDQTVKKLSEVLPKLELGARALAAQSIEEIQAGGTLLREAVGLPETQTLEQSVLETIGDEPTREQQRLIPGAAEFIGGAG